MIILVSIPMLKLEGNFVSSDVTIKHEEECVLEHVLITEKVLNYIANIMKRLGKYYPSRILA